MSNHYLKASGNRCFIHMSLYYHLANSERRGRLFDKKRRFRCFHSKSDDKQIFIKIFIKYLIASIESRIHLLWYWTRLLCSLPYICCRTEVIQLWISQSITLWFIWWSDSEQKRSIQKKNLFYIFCLWIPGSKTMQKLLQFI